MAWLDDIIKNGLVELNGDNKFQKPYAFSRASVSHIPYSELGILTSRKKCDFMVVVSDKPTDGRKLPYRTK